MTYTMPCDFGDVVLVQFPFTSQRAFKKRPAIVVSRGTYNSTKPDVVIMAVTSQLRSPAAPGDIWISDWQTAGLLKPSAIKPVFATVEQNLILARLGSLGSQDQAALRIGIASILG